MKESATDCNVNPSWSVCWRKQSLIRVAIAIGNYAAATIAVTVQTAAAILRIVKEAVARRRGLRRGRCLIAFLDNGSDGVLVVAH